MPVFPFALGLYQENHYQLCWYQRRELESRHFWENWVWSPVANTIHQKGLNCFNEGESPSQGTNQLLIFKIHRDHRILLIQRLRLNWSLVVELTESVSFILPCDVRVEAQAAHSCVLPIKVNIVGHVILLLRLNTKNFLRRWLLTLHYRRRWPMLSVSGSWNRSSRYSLGLSIGDRLTFAPIWLIFSISASMKQMPTVQRIFNKMKEMSVPLTNQKQCLDP